MLLQNYRLDEDDRRGPTPLYRTIDILGRWAKEGSLKSITIRTREPLRHPYDSQQHVEGIISGHLARWRAATSVGQPLAKVFRIVIFTGMNLFALASGCKPIVRFEEIQKELHVAMGGGEIWTEGVLCWRDGQAVREGRADELSAFEWIGGPGLLRPKVKVEVQREIEKMRGQEDEYSRTR